MAHPHDRGRALGSFDAVATLQERVRSVAPQAPRAARLRAPLSALVAVVPAVDLDSPAARRVLARVRAIPPGFVRTYGDCSPGAPRVAGAVLAACPSGAAPWHRVVRADGSLAKGDRQRALLDAEGVPFRGARVDVRVARVLEL